jgi:hypothetical protein
MTITYPLNTELYFNEGAVATNTVVDEFIHPMLELAPQPDLPIPVISHKLYLVPTTDPAIADASIDPIFGPQPSALTELPNVDAWSRSFVIGLIEICILLTLSQVSIGIKKDGS